MILFDRRGGATPTVSIDGSPCLVPDSYTITDTEIQCITEAHQGSIRTYVRVEVGTEGVAYRVSSAVAGTLYAYCLSVVYQQAAII